MNKKIFLTSAVIMCMACPAIAENFPQDGNMLENKTYDNAATYANTGIYEGDVTADAEYSLNPYSVAAGSYFTGIDNSTNQATTATCTSGNFCPGVQSTTFDNNAFGDTGLQTCPNGYASSDLGASANTQCYRTCDIANMGENGTIANIAHAASLSGHDYYGNGADTCEPATCVNGWHVKAAPATLQEKIGSTLYTRQGSINGNGQSNDDAVALGLTQRRTWAVEYGTKGTVFGLSYASARSGTNNDYEWTNPTTVNTTTELGSELSGSSQQAYCYCSVTGYKTNDGVFQSLSSPWVYADTASITCASVCAATALNHASWSQSFARALLSRVTNFISTEFASCEANVINITWNDASAADIAATGAATTVYEGNIKTPLKAVTKPGKTFVGWKFIKPQQTPVEP